MPGLPCAYQLNRRFLDFSESGMAQAIGLNVLSAGSFMAKILASLHN